MAYYYPSPNSSPTSDISYYDYNQDYSRMAQQQQQPRSTDYPSNYGGYPMSPTTSQSSTSQYSTSPDYDYSRKSSTTSTNPPQAFFCLFKPCLYTCGRKADLERHISVTHNRAIVSLVDCDYPGCHRRGVYGFTRKDKMRDHLREVHKMEIPKRVGGGGKREVGVGYER